MKIVRKEEYNIGDKIKIKDNLSLNMKNMVKDMIQYKGAIIEVKEPFYDGVFHDEWFFENFMIEGEVIEESHHFKVKLKDKIEVNDDNISYIDEYKKLENKTLYESRDSFTSDNHVVVFPYGKNNFHKGIYILPKEWVEICKDVLDKEEKRYLKSVIKPFRDNVTTICLEEIDDEYFICIYYENDYTLLPNFKKGTMYKNMELNKNYTLEELGL